MQYCRFIRSLGLTALALVFFTNASTTYAESTTPEVEVDWSVLQALGQPAPATANTKNAPLSRPVQQTWRPSLTAPEQAPASAIAAPPEQMSPPVAAAAIPATPRPQTFPVQTKTRTESTNPSLPPTKPSPVAMKQKAAPVTPLPEEILNKDDIAANIPLPPKKPQAVIKAAALKTPPLPKHRPNIQMASANFVAKARAQAIAKQQPLRQAQPPKVVKQEGPPVPAIPAAAVASEPLRPIAVPLPVPPPAEMATKPAGDPLENEIVNPSKNALIAAIENISKNKFAAFTGKKKPTSGSGRIDAQPLVKSGAIDITAEEPATIAAAASADITEDIAAIEPAAGNASAQIPRPPPQEKYEEDYVSLKYPPGASEPNEEALTQIQKDVLTQLEDNPGWRVQIQAFASPAGEGVSNARRISLSRALAVRTWLMDKGIEASRMDVRALGAESDRQPLDRVDMVLFDPNNG